MANNNKKKKPNTNHPPQKDNNSTAANNSYEYNSFRSSMAVSNAYFGFNIYDLYSPENLSELVKDPIGNNKMLRDISRVLYGTNGVFTNTVDYMRAMPTLDRVVVTHGRSAAQKKKNKSLMESILKHIKDKEFIRDALFKGMIEGIAFYYFETTSRPQSNKKFLTDSEVDSIYEINEAGINASIIALPTDYTEIVGRKNNSYVIAFNLDYFNESSGESVERKLRKFPKEIREAYAQRKQNGYKKGNWVILDSNRTIVHKIRSKQEEKYGRPLVLAAIADITYGDDFVKTKRNVLDEINNRIVYQTFPEGKDKGTSALNKAQQEHQHESVKSAVLNKNNRGGTSFFSVAAGTTIKALDVANTDIFDDKYESNLNDKISLDMGIASSLLNGTASGSYSAQENNLELITAQLFEWIEQISVELNKCISANIIKDNSNWVECKYLPITHVNKSKMVSYAKDLYLQGKGSLSLWAAACGISPEVFFALLDQELEEDIEHKYPVHLTSYTVSGNQDSGGRPVVEDSTNPNTAQSRANNSNNTPKPSNK